MYGASHLVRQGGRFYLRRRVPRDLVPVLGQSEIKRSLDTADPRVARQRLPAADAEVERVFEEARRSGSKIDLPSLVQKVTEAATRPLREEIERDPLLPYRLGDPYPQRPDEREPVIDLILDELAEPWEVELERGYNRQVAAMVEKAGGVKLPEAQQDREAILNVISQAVLRALYDLGHPRSPGLPIPAKPVPPSKSLAEVMDLYLRERKPAPRTAMELRGIVRRLGSSSPIASVTKADARGYKDELLASGSKPATVNKHLNLLKALWSWANRNDYVTGDNPFAGLGVRLDVAAIEQRKPFPRDQLKMFLGGLSGEDLLLARLAALSGARLGELCQLRRCDIFLEDGFWVLVIGAAGHVKNVQSKRRIPIPKTLVGEVLALRGYGSEQLIWSRPNTAAASKRLNRAIRDAGIKDERVTFHSLRHLHADACRASGVSSEIADAIHGHSSGNFSTRYGSGYPVKLLAKAVEKTAGWLGMDRG